MHSRAARPGIHWLVASSFQVWAWLEKATTDGLMLLQFLQELGGGMGARSRSTHDSNCWQLLRLECPWVFRTHPKASWCGLGEKNPSLLTAHVLKLHKPENETGTGPESPLTKGVKRLMPATATHSPCGVVLSSETKDYFLFLTKMKVWFPSLTLWSISIWTPSRGDMLANNPGEWLGFSWSVLFGMVDSINLWPPS